ncbi:MULTISPECIES: hypothetical protein [Streptomyces]|uniref:hypothetical protein n=1 Tax=Streptomyces TaxID=1883 RepID=UPI0001852447|nr:MULTISPECIES: hypothetical protein [Streptomyces]MYT09302.1 hypothetical protein [Streptomyces sp. SID5470]
MSAVVDHLRSTLDLPAAATKAVGGAKSVAGLLDALDEQDEPPSDATMLADRIRGWRDSNLLKHVLDEYALPSMPKMDPRRD